jgi:UDPglucose 6-dehydrogenase
MEEKGVNAGIIGSLAKSNRRQQELPVSVLGKMMKLEGATVAVLGLSFKAGTDDVRGSPAETIIRMLKERKARIRAYDPSGQRMRSVFDSIEYSGGWQECLDGADAVIIATPWPEFGRGADEYARHIGRAPLIDCWRMIGPSDAERAGLVYRAIGRGMR